MAKCGQGSRARRRPGTPPALLPQRHSAARGARLAKSRQPHPARRVGVCHRRRPRGHLRLRFQAHPAAHVLQGPRRRRHRHGLRRAGGVDAVRRLRQRGRRLLQHARKVGGHFVQRPGVQPRSKAARRGALGPRRPRGRARLSDQLVAIGFGHSQCHDKRPSSRRYEAIQSRRPDAAFKDALHGFVLARHAHVGSAPGEAIFERGGARIRVASPLRTADERRRLAQSAHTHRRARSRLRLPVAAQQGPRWRRRRRLRRRRQRRAPRRRGAQRPPRHAGHGRHAGPRRVRLRRRGPRVGLWRFGLWRVGVWRRTGAQPRQQPPQHGHARNAPRLRRQRLRRQRTVTARRVRPAARQHAVPGRLLSGLRRATHGRARSKWGRRRRRRAFETVLQQRI
mmetsp:Transcript_2825/g.8306  ORF Transcript_2825/g.8306 Transcript_2825/m.8306 type:complete len:395 (-) Transcript_2825:128-1312(-)